jgi:signal transduction histidine kinase
MPLPRLPDGHGGSVERPVVIPLRADARRSALHYRGDMLEGFRRWWSDHWRDVIFDGAPPLVLLVLGLLDSVTGIFTEPIGDAPAVTSLIPGAVACLVLVLRRYRPLLTLVIVLAAITIPSLLFPTSLTYWDEFMVWVVALYSCGRHARRAIAYIALGVSAVVMAVLPIEFPELRDIGGILFNSALLAAGFSIGMLARSWAGYRERLIRSAGERAVAEERASRIERARIARELHDVIAHTITVIVMQAGGARLASGSDPAIAVATLAQIEELGRSSLAELRSLLPLLREGDEDAPTSPQPTLAEVGELCERMRRLGLPVALRLDGDLRGLPAGIQLAAYRVVQEGLTNVVKHSGMVDTEVRIVLSAAPAMLAIEVENRMPVESPVAAARGLAGSGRGLRGLEERVRLAGGEFSAGPTEHDGARPGEFLLHVEFPLAREAA